jgi:hypothetical protein
MKDDPNPAPLLATLLSAIYRQPIIAPDAESGIARLAAATEPTLMSRRMWFAAVAEAVAAGYLHDPVRLPPGALQCHWHLELTPKGVERMRQLAA